MCKLYVHFTFFIAQQQTIFMLYYTLCIEIMLKMYLVSYAKCICYSLNTPARGANYKHFIRLHDRNGDGWQLLLRRRDPSCHFNPANHIFSHPKNKTPPGLVVQIKLDHYIITQLIPNTRFVS